MSALDNVTIDTMSISNGLDVDFMQDFSAHLSSSIAPIYVDARAPTDATWSAPAMFFYCDSANDLF